MSILHFNDEQFSHYLISEDKLTLVDLWATWCSPCIALAPVVDDLERHYQGLIQIVKVDLTNDGRKTFTRYPYPIVPVLFLLKGNQVLGRLSSLGESIGEYLPLKDELINQAERKGKTKLSKERIIQFVDQFLQVETPIHCTSLQFFNSQLLVKHPHTFVCFYKADGHYLVDEFHKALERLATQYAGQFNVIFVDFSGDSGQFARQWQLEESPLIQYFKDGINQGQISARSITDHFSVVKQSSELVSEDEMLKELQNFIQQQITDFINYFLD